MWANYRQILFCRLLFQLRWNIICAIFQKKNISHNRQSLVCHFLWKIRLSLFGKKFVFVETFSHDEVFLPKMQFNVSETILIVYYYSSCNFLFCLMGNTFEIQVHFTSNKIGQFMNWHALGLQLRYKIIMILALIRLN